MFPYTTFNGVLDVDAVQYLFDYASPCPRIDHLSSSPFFHFSPIINHEEDGGDIAFLPHQQDHLLDGHLYPHHLLMPNASSTTTPATAEAFANRTTDEPKLQLPAEDICLMGPHDQTHLPKKKKMSCLGRNRRSKKDRHSKIFTRQGPRDRRMRLSLEIARKFFSLQDLLGFDKASKTVDWLMTKSRQAIKQLAKDLSCTTQLEGGGSGSGTTSKSAVSSASEGEVESGCDEYYSGNVEYGRKEKGKVPAGKERNSRQSRKAAINPLSKEGRAIARAWARERTKKKKMMRRNVDGPTNQLPDPNNYYEHDQHQLTGEEPGSQIGVKKPSSELLAEVEEEEAPSFLCLNHQRYYLHDAINDSLSMFLYHPQISISTGVTNSDSLNSLQNADVNNFLQHDWDMDGETTNSGAYANIPNAHLSAGNLQERSNW